MVTIPIRKALEKNNEWAYEISSLEGQFKQDCRLLAQSSSRVTRRLLLDLSEGVANIGCGILILDGRKTVWLASSSMDAAAHWYVVQPLMQKPYLTQVTFCEIPISYPQRYRTVVLDQKGRAGVRGAYDRIVDSEYKILSSIAVYLDSIPDIMNMQGELFLYTDREPCASCSLVIAAFANEFQKITVTTFFRRWAS